MASKADKVKVSRAGRKTQCVNYQDGPDKEDEDDMVAPREELTAISEAEAIKAVSGGGKAFRSAYFSAQNVLNGLNCLSEFDQGTKRMFKDSLQ